MIKIQQVWMRYPIPKRYRDLLLRTFARRKVNTALNNVSLDCQKGDSIALLGPNGAGKTTLLKLIGGLLIPSKGTISVNNCDTVRDNRAVRKSVGFVLNEERSFFWRLTGRQNLEFFGTLDNMEGQNLRDRCRDLIRLVGLEEAADRRVSDYSSGMKQRLAIARGLIADPEILILDEPTRALDPIAVEDLVELLLERIQADSERGLLIATHRFEEAIALCNKALIIKGGRLLSYVRLADLAERGISLSEHYKECVNAPEEKPL